MTVFDIKYFIKTEFFGYARELQLHTKRLINVAHHPKQKFVIFSTGRSGSTLLLNLMNNNPKIHCAGELLRSKTLSPRKVIKHSSQINDKQVFGFKLLSYQLLNLQPTIKNKKSFLEHLVEDGYQIIYLERKNSLLQALSVIYAMERNVWHYKNEVNIEHTKITLNPQKLANMIHEFEQFKLKERALLGNLPYLYINYEQDLEQAANLKTTVFKLERYLNLSLQEPLIHLRKVTPRKLSSFLHNAREISKFVHSQKKYEQFTTSDLDAIF